MKSKTFGKKCKCGHYESEHIPRKPNFSNPKTSPDLGIVFPRSYVADLPKRISCKICECKMFAPSGIHEFLKGPW